MQLHQTVTLFLFNARTTCPHTPNYLHQELDLEELVRAGRLKTLVGV
jgi:hypothetical protein